MNAIALCHPSTFSPRSALAFPQPPPLRVLRAALAARLRRPVQPTRLELRIDVNQPEENIGIELDALYRRLHTAGDPINACTRLPAPLPGLILHHRETDGDHYVYVEDTIRGCLAGYAVFSRLIEVDRRTDRHVRSPHSKYAPAYRGRGIASTVYDWALGRGLCLVSGARQSAGAHALWRALARRHPLSWVALRDKRMHDLGMNIPPEHAAGLDIRMILLGHGWSLPQLHARSLLHPVVKAAATDDALARRHDQRLARAAPDREPRRGLP